MALPKDDRKSIRGLDPDLFQRAREAALHSKKTLGGWFNEAIVLKLKKEEKKKQNV